jgi:hypothetical protein
LAFGGIRECTKSSREGKKESHKKEREKNMFQAEESDNRGEMDTKCYMEPTVEPISQKFSQLAWGKLLNVPNQDFNLFFVLFRLFFE